MLQKRRSPCPVACTLDLIGDRWTLLVVRDLFCGRRTFKEFAAGPERIATNILADRLERLVAAELASKSATGYALTPRGLTLLPVLQAVADWGLANIEGTEARMTVETR
jgi:DNA-binding HxlR family transcriptional regulator